MSCIEAKYDLILPLFEALILLEKAKENGEKKGFFCLYWTKLRWKTDLVGNIIVIYLRTDKSYTIYLKLLSRFPNSQMTVT